MMNEWQKSLIVLPSLLTIIIGTSRTHHNDGKNYNMGADSNQNQVQVVERFALLSKCDRYITLQSTLNHSHCNVVETSR